MRKALGKGLDALLPKNVESSEPPAKQFSVPLDKIRPNHLQPRKIFDPERLSELAATIKEHGLAQPIVVSYDAASKTYELIAGERRLRAAELVGLQEIDVVIRPMDSDRQRLTLALIENLQREDLNPIELAQGYLRLMKESQLSQTQLGGVVSKSKSAISNTLRLLDLPESMQKALQLGQLTEGHARALLMVEDPLEKQRLFNIAVERKISVRELEDLVHQTMPQASGPEPRQTPRPAGKEKSAEVKDMESNLQHTLGTKVEIKTRKDPSCGTITIHFYSHSDFDRIVQVMKKA